MTTPPKPRKKASAQMPKVMVLTVTANGEKRVFEFRPSEVTARVARMVRQATGMSLVSALATFEADPDIDALATVAYAAALQVDRGASFEEIEELITYDAEFELDVADETLEVSDPET